MGRGVQPSFSLMNATPTCNLSIIQSFLPPSPRPLCRASLRVTVSRPRRTADFPPCLLQSFQHKQSYLNGSERQHQCLLNFAILSFHVKQMLQKGLRRTIPPEIGRGYRLTVHCSASTPSALLFPKCCLTATWHRGAFFIAHSFFSNKMHNKLSGVRNCDHAPLNRLKNVVMERGIGGYGNG